MADDQPLSDTQTGDRLAAALDALGTAPGLTTAADTVLSSARMVLTGLSIGLLESAERRDSAMDPQPPETSVQK